MLASKPLWSMGSSTRIPSPQLPSTVVLISSTRQIGFTKWTSYKKKATASQLARNAQAKPVPFTELAHHVKQHPSHCS